MQVYKLTRILRVWDVCILSFAKFYAILWKIEASIDDPISCFSFYVQHSWSFKDLNGKCSWKICMIWLSTWSRKEDPLTVKLYAHPSHEMYNSGSVVVDHSLHLWSSTTLLSSWKQVGWTITGLSIRSACESKKGHIWSNEFEVIEPYGWTSFDLSCSNLKEKSMDI